MFRFISLCLWLRNVYLHNNTCCLSDFILEHLMLVACELGGFNHQFVMQALTSFSRRFLSGMSCDIHESHINSTPLRSCSRPWRYLWCLILCVRCVLTYALYLLLHCSPFNCRYTQVRFFLVLFDFLFWLLLLMERRLCKDLNYCPNKYDKILVLLFGCGKPGECLPC